MFALIVLFIETDPGLVQEWVIRPILNIKISTLLGTNIQIWNLIKVGTNIQIWNLLQKSHDDYSDNDVVKHKTAIMFFFLRRFMILKVDVKLNIAISAIRYSLDQSCQLTVRYLMRCSEIFHGRPEINIKPWVTLVKELDEGNKRIAWKDRDPHAYWKGNYRVARTRQDLMKCNVRKHKDWNAWIYPQVFTLAFPNLKINYWKHSLSIFYFTSTFKLHAH